MTKRTIFKQLGSVLALAGILSFMTATVVPRRADAVVGLVVAAPVAIVTGAVIASIAIASAAGTWVVSLGADLGGPMGNEGVIVSLIAAPILFSGLVILPADLSGQYRFPELKNAPQGISESEFSDYIRDRATLEVLAQDVRAEVARDIVTEAQWKAMSESEQKSWAESRLQVAGKLWAEYVNEGLISDGSLKTLAAVSQK